MKKRTCKVCKGKFIPERHIVMALCGYECALEYNRKLKEKADKKKLKEMKVEVYSKENKKYLQAEINKLARMIDAKYDFTTCIDCNRKFGKQIDAAHYHSRGANSSLSYNLHNLHSAKSDCNKFSENHKGGYLIGLIERYGKKYADYVISDLPLKYPLIKLTAKEVYEKLSIVRKLNRTFDTFQFENSIQARKQLNKLIGIYPDDAIEKNLKEEKKTENNLSD